ncbi:hypothetical protein E4U56_003330 [Claviceps arundinis]|uniref:2EXR domain-containing protein n=1 Tax=Claviceps arundinis TaxID=1623583 RepID=A0A9P7N096_9HYPO|nr:hypothetical protein E4U56_003330 [Claviceps arundinis]
MDHSGSQSNEGSPSENRYQNEDSAPRLFPKFMQLPPELRHLVWELYCPELSVKARVLQFMLADSILTTHSALAYQTKTLRAMQSTHHESRTIALRRYPNKLNFELGPYDTACIWFRKETDVVALLDDVPHLDLFYWPGFADEIENFAIRPVQDIDDTLNTYSGNLLEEVAGLRNAMPNLKRLFSQWPAEFKPRRYKDWCVSDNINKYLRETYKPENGLTYNTHSLFCWPDLDAHPIYTRSSVHRLCSDETMERMGVEVWPLVDFQWRKGLNMYDTMKRVHFNPELADELEPFYADAYDESDLEEDNLPDDDDDDDGTDAVDDGTDAVDDGTDAVDDGTGAVDDGTDAVDDGTDVVDDGTDAVNDGTDVVDDGADAVDDGTDAVNDGNEERNNDESTGLDGSLEEEQLPGEEERAASLKSDLKSEDT